MKNLVRVGSTFMVPGPVTSGDPVVVGLLSGVVSVTAVSGDSAVVEKTGVYSLSVEAVGAGITGGAAIYHHAGSTPVLNNTSAAGVLFGYADAGITTITTGATATINVMLKG